MSDISIIFIPKHQAIKHTVQYTLISDRVKAMIVDSIILIIAMYLSSFLLGQFGGSIGHTFFDLTVSSNEKKKAIHDWAVASVTVVEA